MSILKFLKLGTFKDQLERTEKGVPNVCGDAGKRGQTLMSVVVRRLEKAGKREIEKRRGRRTESGSQA